MFQVFAQLIELRSKPLPPVYMQIFPPLLSPVFWERSGNVPALVRLIQVGVPALPLHVCRSRRWAVCLLYCCVARLSHLQVETGHMLTLQMPLSSWAFPWLQAYLSKAGDEVVKGGHLLPLLGVFQKLIASKAHDHEGFDILNAVVDNLLLNSYEQFLPTIFTLLFSRYVARTAAGSMWRSSSRCNSACNSLTRSAALSRWALNFCRAEHAIP